MRWPEGKKKLGEMTPDEVYELIKNPFSACPDAPEVKAWEAQKAANLKQAYVNWRKRGTAAQMSTAAKRAAATISGLKKEITRLKRELRLRDGMTQVQEREARKAQAVERALSNQALGMRNQWRAKAVKVAPLAGRHLRLVEWFFASLPADDWFGWVSQEARSGIDRNSWRTLASVKAKAGLLEQEPTPGYEAPANFNSRRVRSDLEAKWRYRLTERGRLERERVRALLAEG